MTLEVGVGEPVFVDPSGRRARAVRRACWLLSAVMIGYVLLVLVSLVAPAGSFRLTIPGLGPVLPGPAAGRLVDRTGQNRKPAAVLAPSATARPATSPTPVSAATTAATAGTTAHPTGPAGARPSSPPTTAATPSQGATGRPTAQPTPTKTPPGQVSPRPTPRSTRAHQPRPTSSP